jgi:hypothetical protein
MLTFYPLARESWGWLLHALGYPDVPPAFEYRDGYGNVFPQKVGFEYQRADGSRGIFNRQLNIDLRAITDAYGVGEHIRAALRSGPRPHRFSIRGYGRLPVDVGFDSALVWSPEVPVLMRIVHEYREKGQPVYDFTSDRLVPAHLAPPPVSQIGLLLDVELPPCGAKTTDVCVARTGSGFTDPTCQREQGHTAPEHAWEGPSGLKMTWLDPANPGSMGRVAVRTEGAAA